MPDDAVRYVYLTGQPGCGKTVLARQYAEKIVSCEGVSKSLIVSLNASSEDSLLKSVKAALPKLNLSAWMQSTEYTISSLMKQLKNVFSAHNGAWFLIVDDLFEKNVFNKFLPQPGCNDWGKGQVLVTTQDDNLLPAFHSFAKRLSLNKGMTSKDALALLQQLSGFEVDEFAEDVIKELNYLPLALACCAVYVKDCRQNRTFTWKEYFDLHKENGPLELRTFSNDVYPMSMKAATTMAVRRMAETNHVLKLTFFFLSYCTLLPVPMDVLVQYVLENLSNGNDKKPKTKENDIVNEISRCTLLICGRSQNVKTVKFHQVSHDVFQAVENTSSATQRQDAFGKMMKSLNKTLDFTNNREKDHLLLKVLVRPHLASFIDHAIENCWNNTSDFVLLSMKLGQFFFSTQKMPDELSAVESLEKLYTISRELDLPEDQFCDILANLGFYYLELARNEDALNFLSKTFLMTKDKEGGKWLLLRCRTSFNLARTNFTLKNVDVAIRMMKTSIELAKIVYHNKESNVIIRYFWLACFYDSLNKSSEIVKIAEEARQFLYSGTAYSASIDRARCLSNLANIFTRCDSYPTLLIYHLYEESLSIYEKVLKADASLCPEYCTVFFQSALLALLHRLPGEKLEICDRYITAVKYCIGVDDRISIHTALALANSVSNQSSWITFIKTVMMGYDATAALLMSDNVLEECKSVKMSLSPRIINDFKTVRAKQQRKVCQLVLLLVFLGIFVFVLWVHVFLS